MEFVCLLNVEQMCNADMFRHADISIGQCPYMCKHNDVHVCIYKQNQLKML